jgi:hypothetical protein
VDLTTYLETVRDRLAEDGFTDEPAADGATIQLRRRAVKASRLSFVETVVAVRSGQEPAGSEDVRAFTTNVVSAALARKSKIPRGLGSSLVVYPAVVVEECSTELRMFMASYVPKHWCLLVLPVVVDARTGGLVMYEQTPMWGALYQRTTRNDAKEWLSVSNNPGE